MKARLVIAAVAGLTGLTFLLQGLGYLAGSVMTGDPFWAFVGAGLIGLAILLAIPSLGRRAR